MWDRAQKRIASKGHRVQRRRADKELSLFAGVLHCADCGSILAYTTKHLKNSTIGAYRCTRYINNGKTACSIHYIQEDSLVTFVLNDIRLHAKLANAERERITNQLLSHLNQAHGKEARKLEKQKREDENRLAAIAANIKSLYEDKCLGKFPKNIFESLLSDFVAEQSALEDKLQKTRLQINNQACTEHEIEKWLRLISQYMDLTELDRQTVMELIETITIGERKRENGKRIQEITIQYRFIGNLLADAKEDIA